MMVEEQYYDLMNRTIRNLEFLNALRRSREKQGFDTRVDGPYEFTQLLNSFLGAFALPREKDLPLQLTQIRLEDAHNRWGVPLFDDDYPDYIDTRVRKKPNHKPEHLNDLIRLTRNGILHGNFEIEGDMNIQRLKFWNENLQGTPTWGATVDVATMRHLLYSFYRVAEYLYAEARSPRKIKVA